MAPEAICRSAPQPSSFAVLRRNIRREFDLSQPTVLNQFAHLQPDLRQLMFHEDSPFHVVKCRQLVVDRSQYICKEP